MSEKYSELLVLEEMDANDMNFVVGGRRGADDPAGHDANDDNGRRGKRGGKGRGRGADDPQPHS